MRSIVIDRVALVCLSVGVFVAVVGPAKTAHPIEMPFRLRTRVGSRNHDCIRWGLDLHGKGQF